MQSDLSVRPEIAGWWRGAALDRFIADLVGDVLTRLRPGRQAQARPGELAFDTLDSLERVRLAMAIEEALQAPAAPADERPSTALTSEVLLAEWRRRMASAEGAIGFRTSGSARSPRLIVHGLEDLAREIEAHAETFAGVARIVSLIPAHHIYGFLFTVLLPLRLGVPVLEARGLTPLSLAAELVPGDLVIAAPAHWQIIADASLTWPRDVQGVTSSAPCPQAVAESLRRQGLGRLVEIYGSTETAGIGWRQAPAAPFELFAYWSRVDDSHIAKPSKGGAWRTFELPDHVVWHGVRALTPTARRDGAVQVGGINVLPERVRSVLCAHPDVADAIVRLMRPDEGDRLKAFVVPKDQGRSEDELRIDIERWLTERLEPMALPRAITFGSELPRNVMGKTADWILGA